MNPLPCTSREFLDRARSRLESGADSGLLYAAIDIRLGIESRLIEYLEGAKKVSPINSKLWQLKDLKREVESRLDVHNSAVQLALSSERGEEVLVEYTPVTDSLKKVGEKLGYYLHFRREFRDERKATADSLRELVKSGIDSLAFSTRGTLVAPPIGDGPDKVKLVFEAGMVPNFVKKGELAVVKLKAVLVSQDEKWVVLKPTS